MPLTRYLFNRVCNEEQRLVWGYDSVSCDYATVRYEDVDVVKAFFTHSTSSVNLVKTDDTMTYVIKINEIYITRSHSAFNRVSSKAKSISAEIHREFQDNLEKIYRYIIPRLFVRKATQLMEVGSVEIASMRFRSDGTVIIKGATYAVKDLDFQLVNGSWYVMNTAKRTFFGNAKQVATISTYEDNALIIEPMVKFAKTL